ncbi:MAG: hypothetical protein M3Y77_07620 [Actinomycetota bacterium]|nr:hypothetical protein [Actinomycetota bacterium]
MATGARALLARQARRPYDRNRTERFDVLVATLLASTPQNRPQDLHHSGAYRFLPFFEAYFPNYIEGTQFNDPALRVIGLLVEESEFWQEHGRAAKEFVNGSNRRSNLLRVNWITRERRVLKVVAATAKGVQLLERPVELINDGFNHCQVAACCGWA